MSRHFKIVLSRNGGHGSIEEDEHVNIRGGKLADTDFDFESASLN